MRVISLFIIPFLLFVTSFTHFNTTILLPLVLFYKSNTRKQFEVITTKLTIEIRPHTFLEIKKMIKLTEQPTANKMFK